MSGSGLFVLLAWVLDATLKGGVVIALVAVVQQLIGKRIGASWRHALWLLVFVRLVVPIAPSSAWSVFNLLPRAHTTPVMTERAVPRTLTVVASPGAAAPEVFRTAAAPAGWRWIAAAWLFGALALFLRSGIAALRVELAIRRRRQAAALQVVDDVRRRLGVRRTVRVIETGLVDAPALHGVLRPVLLLPEHFVESFGSEELRHVALHELWHLRRFDVAVNWLLSAVAAIHWFNPLVWFAVSRIREERELACDELALSCLEEDERLGYGRTILKLLECFRTATPVPALVGIVNHKQKMKRRILMITSYRNRTRFPLLFAAALALVGLVGFTDARGGERHHVLRDLDPAAMQTVEKLSQRVTLDVQDASLSDLVTLVSNATGVAVTQSPEAAASKIQQARFTLHADNVPAHAILHTALLPFHLTAKPDANGVTIAQLAEGEEAGEQHIEIRREAVEDGVAGGVEGGVKGGVEGGVKGSVKMEKRITIRETSSTHAAGSNSPLHRELNFTMDENGVKSEGKLVLDITGVTK